MENNHLTLYCVNCGKFILSPQYYLGENSNVTKLHEGIQSIYCHYGSIYDTMKFDLSNYILKEGKICDECITTLLSKKLIIEDKNFNYWN